MITIVLLATAWGSKHGGINVVNMELARALAQVLGARGRVLCVVPHAVEAEFEDAVAFGVDLLSLDLRPESLPDMFDPGWVGSVKDRLAAADVLLVDWCVGHDVISGAAANLMGKLGHASGSAVISHMSYADYQGVKHPTINPERKIQAQEAILRNADVAIAVGPLLRDRAIDTLNREVPFFIPGLTEITSRPARTQFVGISFGRFERDNDRIKQIQLAAEGFAEARRRAQDPGHPAILNNNPTLKLIGVAENDEESADLRRAMQECAGRMVTLRPMPYQQDREALYQEIAGSSVALMLSWHEGFGLTGWEAIAAQVPLILSKQSGLHMFLHEEHVSKLVYEVSIEGSLGDGTNRNFTDRDRKNVADLILEIAGKPKDAAGRAARVKDLLKDYTWERAARDVLAALRVHITPDDQPGLVNGSDNASPSSPAQELSLNVYLARLRQEAGSVRLAGEFESRPLQDVFVELEVTRGRIREKQDLDGDNEAAGEDLALQTELRRRRNAPWRRLTETLPAKDLIDFSHRTLIIGAAGTGKSTLLRWLACEAARLCEEDPRARVPIWLRNLPQHQDIQEDVEGTLARRALASVKLGDGPSAAEQAIREAIASGRALFLIDGLDESGVVEQHHAAEWLAELESRVILASRPLVDGVPLRDVETVTLHGIPGIAAEQMLQKYFPDDPWVNALLAALRVLPDGQTWLETPVLLGLAATLFRADNSLPGATIELYRRAVDYLLSTERLPSNYRGGTLRGELQIFARDRLLPSNGSPRVLFESSEVEYRRQDFYRRTGLFEGTSRWRFTHLTLGEYLAAEAPIDLRAERTRLLAPEGNTPEGGSLEVVPMAHALQGTTVLQEALADAQERDLHDHRLLRLLLRSLGYGGEAVREFCVIHGGAVLRLIAGRLDAPSGRFGEAERALMDAAERALLAMRGLVRGEEVEQVFARLLRLPGDAGTEAHITTWTLGSRAPERRRAMWWQTIERQARSLVRANVGINGILGLTQGAEGFEQCRAAMILAKYPEYLPKVRLLLHNDSDIGRRYLSPALADDPGSEPDWRERLGDEDEVTREVCANHLASGKLNGAIYLPRLRDMLTRDPSERVRAAAIDGLADDPESREQIRGVLIGTFDLSQNMPYERQEVRGAALRALAADTLSEQMVEAFISNPACRHYDNKTLKSLIRIPRWRQVLRQRLESPDVTGDDIEALGDDAECLATLNRLLDSSRDDIVYAVLNTLGGRADVSRSLRLLDHPHEAIRCAAISAVGDARGADLTRLRKFLTGSANERRAAATALRGDAASLGEIQENLLRYPEWTVRGTAIDVLSAHSIAHAALREYFDETRSSPEHEGFDEDGAQGPFILHRALRGQIVKALAGNPHYKDMVESSLEDPHSDVRAEAVRAFASDPGMKDRLERMFASEAEVSVHEAIVNLMPEHDFVRQHLLLCLNSDISELRFAVFRYLVDSTAERARLKRALALPSVPSSWRCTILGPLMRDPSAMELVRACVDDRSEAVRNQALHLLRHDRLTREELRDRARDVEWLKGLTKNPLASHYRDRVSSILAGDPDAHPILAGHLSLTHERTLAFVVPMLRDYSPARPRLVELLEHPAIEVQEAAILALGTHEPVRDRILAALAPDPPSMSDPDEEPMERHERSVRRGHLRRAAAEVLAELPEYRINFRALLDNHDKVVRRYAIRAVSADRRPEARALLRAHLGQEQDEQLRLATLHALRGEIEAVEPMRERLHNDYRRSVRRTAADALGLGDPEPANALREQPLVVGILGIFSGGVSVKVSALHAFLAEPRRVDLDSESELGEQVLAWACARMGWAHELERLQEGQLLGEVSTPLVRLGAPGGVTLIRVAMDSFDLARDRFLRPNHNLLETWDVVKHLVAADPPTVVLACADVAFSHLQPPVFKSGEVRFGPTFFGFRVRSIA